ncbi:hypothetical protein GJR96_03745 [Haloferax sp. MBLA0076]|uniref:Small CPxCG-related zinc finger protein n=1 Tax=Haloferax litoreum TaxID=2666140 RepID=A0A6A8GH45_9EURY|nr:MULTISPECIES: DUF6276 family protein [Haloferax]KAB1192597.1 hypothetical protein Hfx1148_03740 [Haloferax sp. CBA1148]MRX21070.1 hypothetical protein [Haloferax litoreum]
MPCPNCGGDEAVFAVPEPLEEYAPQGAVTIGLCADCLRVHPSDERVTDGDARPLGDVIPDGEGGAAFALLVGFLDSLALNREAIVESAEYAEREGVDVHLTLDRLEQSVSDPHFDVGRRHTQLETFL